MKQASKVICGSKSNVIKLGDTAIYQAQERM